VRRRLDLELVRRGIAATRSEADMAIRMGKVTVGGRPATKSGMLVGPAEPIVLAGETRRYVSRGGEKLDAALVAFGVDPSGRRALDAGASTGGFTDCLLARGAGHVVAVDVGYGQLDWRLRRDPRVTVLERTNVRALGPSDVPYRPELVVADLSFISLDVVLPALAGVASGRAEFVLLVKPQFEAGRAEVGPGGVVSDPGVWDRVLHRVWSRLVTLGIEPAGVVASPLLGPAGNVEFFVHGRRGTPDGEEVADADAEIASAVEHGLGLAGTRPKDRAP
jgi:23S rRNA (cytidine1920-2'-O)/16S rRNA (cytidine1409-2'-O)-methyltransferase